MTGRTDPVLCAVAAGGALWLVLGRPDGSLRRLRLLHRLPRRPAPRAPSRPVAVATATGALVGVALGLPAGGPLGLLVGVVVWRLLLRRAGPHPPDMSTLPLACDLLAAVLRAGAPVPEAVRCAAAAVGGRIAGDLERVAASYELGAPANEAWAALDGLPQLRRLAGAAVRAAASGAALASTCQVLAAELREAAIVERQARAKRAGVLITAPLACCFLPAFVLIGVVPFVAGLMQGALG